jgi:dTDP-4-amino-4,6-dideoxygalactose transaminase
MQMNNPVQIANYLPVLEGRESEYVLEALRTGWVSYGGAFVTRFEREVAARLGFADSVAMASGTCALQIALELIDAAGTEALLPALTFAAPASVVVRAGITPVLIDLAPKTWQIDPDMVDAFIAERCDWDGKRLINRGSGRRVAALTIVHLYGSMADMARLYATAARYDLAVVHDGAQCFGAFYNGAPLGTIPAPGVSTIVAATSFNANKIITTGTGGALVSNRPELTQRGRHVSSTAKTNTYSFEHDALGLNYRMGNVAAAMGVGQLEQMDQFIATKRRNDALYRQLISAAIPSAQLERYEAGVQSNHWMFCMKIDRPAEPVIKRLQAAGIQARPLWIPLPRLKPYSGYEVFQKTGQADQLWEYGLMLPSGAHLGESDIRRVVSELTAALAA